MLGMMQEQAIVPYAKTPVTPVLVLLGFKLCVTLLL